MPHTDTESALGEFPGSELNFVDCEAVALAHIKPVLLAKERDLIKTRWFDVRAYHPTRATLFFAHAYTRAHARRDHQRAGSMRRGYRGKDPFQASPTTYTGLWKARQNADLHGIPYDFYTHKAMQWADERLWTLLPRPSQLYSAILTEYLVEEWESHQTHSARLAINPRYLASNYIGHVDQVAYQAYLLTIARASSVTECVMSDMLGRGHLLETLAQRAVGSSQVTRLKAMYSQQDDATIDTLTNDNLRTTND